ncbi:aldehyde dehydrogenase (NADP(+)) [Prauserella cavernicola]|uniref:Aldehyde dehydrogenase (NADP(+)) n=1 Tax=Prauserella cavernicola TaxID=2800127 RepID=A0A934V7I2_9PSEU|nr:aldehyde dehydrogenase (NADP(+)) [Prauserella cavernicola]MBK1786763.1 aldehyde dehydrogenase (NADP(+)) [Prauserella cavernicola]
MSHLQSVNPRTGQSSETEILPSTPDDVDAAATRARAAFAELSLRHRAWRAGLLRALADGLESRREQIVATADGETGLGEPRLNGELTRTCFQLRLFADVVTEGGYLEATVDHAGDTAMGPRPDLRRMLLPLGPVAVFGASNFPLAFSVPGGDTASALAAGCPVIVKAHGSHVLTSRLCGEALEAAAIEYGAPEGTIGVVYGREAGVRLVRHPDIKAVGFTGSLGGGKALLELINTRPEPIPFYGELSGINPLVVTQAAAKERADEIGAGLAGSFTLGAGQFCTKPGLAFVPRTDEGEAVLAALRTAVEGTGAQVLLNKGIRDSFASGSERLAGLSGVGTAATGGEPDDSGFTAQPRVLTIDAAELDTDVATECFGPLVVVVRYSENEELLAAMARLEPSLTSTVHLGTDEATQATDLLAGLQAVSGRLVFDGYPTGVAVSWAQHHGGPWPSTNSIHTSVGTTAIRRFLRPFAWQGAPQAVLPPELRDGSVDVPVRVDGVLTLPGNG